MVSTVRRSSRTPRPRNQAVEAVSNAGAMTPQPHAATMYSAVGIGSCAPPQPFQLAARGRRFPATPLRLWRAQHRRKVPLQFDSEPWLAEARVLAVRERGSPSVGV